MKDSRFEFVRMDAKSSEYIAAPAYSYWGSVRREFFGKKITVFLLVVVIILSLVAFIQPSVSGRDPTSPF